MTLARTLRIATGLTVTVATLFSPISGQDSDELDRVLGRLGLYLLDYEAALSTIVASERYDQHEIRVGRVRGRTASTVVSEVTRRRKLESEVAFLRLPGGASWLGVREVRSVDGKPVTTDPSRLLALVKQFGRDSDLEEAGRIIAASSVHNLGSLRTINMPTTPLELLHPDHHVQYVFKLKGRDKIDGVMTSRIEFEEFDEPTIIANPQGSPLFIRGTAWVETANGRLWRAQIVVRPKFDPRLPRSVETRLRVDYAFNSDLQMLVPKEMSEDFFVIGGRGAGTAKYSNYRRFTTTGRIVPQ